MAATLQWEHETQRSKAAHRLNCTYGVDWTSLKFGLWTGTFALRTLFRLPASNPREPGDVAALPSPRTRPPTRHLTGQENLGLKNPSGAVTTFVLGDCILLLILPLVRANVTFLVLSTYNTHKTKHFDSGNKGKVEIDLQRHATLAFS